MKTRRIKFLTPNYFFPSCFSLAGFRNQSRVDGVLNVSHSCINEAGVLGIIKRVFRLSTLFKSFVLLKIACLRMVVPAYDFVAGEFSSTDSLSRRYPPESENNLLYF